MPVVTKDWGDQWSQLPPELLQVICVKLPDTADLVRFRAVCRPWRDGAPLYAPPPQLPWLLERSCGSRLKARKKLRFFSPSSGGARAVRFGGSSWLVASGACQGRVVVTVDLSRTMLYNPFVGEARSLPPAPYPPWRRGVFRVAEGGGGEAECLVVNTSTKRRHFAYCRPGVDARWNVFDERDDMLGSSAYHGGRFFVNTHARETLVIDAATLSVEAVVPPPPRENFATATGDYLVASRGRLLRAVLHPRDGSEAASAADHYFNVYRLRLAAREAAWSKVETVGDAVLFFDDHGHGLSLEPNGAAGLRRDCVYFVHEEQEQTWVEFGEYRFLCRYSMEDGKVDKTLPLSHAFGDTWVVPSLCHSYSDE